MSKSFISSSKIFGRFFSKISWDFASGELFYNLIAFIFSNSSSNKEKIQKKLELDIQRKRENLNKKLLVFSNYQKATLVLSSLIQKDKIELSNLEKTKATSTSVGKRPTEKKKEAQVISASSSITRNSSELLWITADSLELLWSSSELLRTYAECLRNCYGLLRNYSKLQRITTKWQRERWAPFFDFGSNILLKSYSTRNQKGSQVLVSLW